MKKERLKILLIGMLLLPFFAYSKTGDKPSVFFPYRHAGLSSTQAAAHLLSRFSFGIKPGQVDIVVSMGLEHWFDQQLAAGLPDDPLEDRLKQYDALHLSNTKIAEIYPKAGQVLRMAINDGIISKDSVNENVKKVYKELLISYMQQKGLREEKELYKQLVDQKIVRAAYSNNQLQEVLTDLWFDHFNVAVVKNDCAPYILGYERDVIRPNALGNFATLLLGTAQSPAMLYYLDNFSSSVTDTGNIKRAKRNKDQASAKMADTAHDKASITNRKKPRGLNENYAREVMELHTMGVDGGYTQKDITEAARILTGWTVYPMGEYGNKSDQRQKMARDSIKQKGFIHHDDFVFIPSRHDKGEKTVLGHRYPAGGGYEEGVDLLNILAHQPATATFICHKMAVRFVSDDPPKKLVSKMAATFMKTGGDIKAVLLTMVMSPDFWAPAALLAKTKSPFELAISTVRSLNADVEQPYQLFKWMDRMGQKIYYYQAPTGFPDKAEYWINTGALLNRMNFGLAFASGRIPGIKADLRALNNSHEPESADAALTVYSRVMMPGRDLTTMVKKLSPMLTEPGLAQKVSESADRATPSKDNAGDMTEHTDLNKQAKDSIPKKNEGTMLSQVTGIIIGAPEFQKR